MCGLWTLFQINEMCPTPGDSSIPICWVRNAGTIAIGMHTCLPGHSFRGGGADELLKSAGDSGSSNWRKWSDDDDDEAIMPPRSCRMRALSCCFSCSRSRISYRIIIVTSAYTCLKSRICPNSALCGENSSPVDTSSQPAHPVMHVVN